MKYTYFYLFFILSLIFNVSCASIKESKKPITVKILNGKSFTLANENNVKITISFDENRFYGFTGLNNYFGSYEIQRGNSIILSGVGQTMKSGPPYLMEYEFEYLKMLKEVAYIFYGSETLILETINGYDLTFYQSN